MGYPHRSPVSARTSSPKRAVFEARFLSPLGIRCSGLDSVTKWVSHTHAVSFHERRHNHSQLFGEVLSSQAHVVGQSTILKRVSHLLDFLVLASDGVELEECFSGLVHPQREGLGAFDTVFRKEQGREKKLVTEDSNPVGSGRFREQTRDAEAVPGLFLALLIRIRPRPFLSSAQRSTPGTPV
jgi:hypothetical protein